MRDGFLEVGGSRLWFEDAGNGFPVVLLHGGLVHSGVWDELIAGLTDRYRAIRFDARGYGQSSMPAGSFSRVGDALGVMDALGVKHAVLIGLSMGGEAAIDLALEHPERFQALVLEFLDGIA